MCIPGMLVELETVGSAHNHNPDMIPFIIIVGQVDGIAQLRLAFCCLKQEDYTEYE